MNFFPFLLGREMSLVSFFCLCFGKLWLRMNEYDEEHCPQLFKFRANSSRNDKRTYLDLLQTFAIIAF